MIKRIDIRKIIDRYIGIPTLALLKLFTVTKQTKSKAVYRKKARDILVIYLSGIGDTVMVSACLTSLANHFPSAQISFFSSSQNHDILRDNPVVSRHFLLQTKKGAIVFLQSLVENVRRIRAARFDILMDFEQFIRLSAMVAVLAHAPISVGFKTRNQFRHCAYSHPQPFNPLHHTLDNFVSLLSPLGVENSIQGLEQIPISTENRAFIDALMMESGVTGDDIVVGIHVGSGGTARSRRWDPDKFRIITNMLLSEFKATVLFTGSKDEWEMIETIRTRTLMPESCLNFAGKCSLGQLPALVTHCHAFLSNDTGPMHVAAAMKTPTVALFGPNSPARYGPVGGNHQVVYKSQPCSPCILAHEGVVPQCTDNQCMKRITVTEVWESLNEVLGKQGIEPHHTAWRPPAENAPSLSLKHD